MSEPVDHPYQPLQVRYPVFEYAGRQFHFVMHKDEGGFFGGLYHNLPTPSGCDRWLPKYTDTRRFATDVEADKVFRAHFIQEFTEASEV